MADARNKVLLVDDHPIAREGMRSLLERSDEFEIVGQAGDGIEAVDCARDLKPDLVIMDILMPGMEGVGACREIREMLPETRVLILTVMSDEDAVVSAVAAGASGYVHKSMSPSDVLEAVRDVSKGRSRIPDETMARVFSIIRGDPGFAPRKGPRALTRLETDVLKQFCTGRSYSEIAEANDRSPTTIRNTIYRIQQKLEIDTKQELVVWAVRNGLLDDALQFQR